MLAVTLICFATILTLYLSTGIYYAKSKSLKHVVFFMFKGSRFKRGDFVGIKNHDTKYVKGIHITKRVFGVRGDLVKTVKDVVFINGKPIGHAKSKTQKGYPLTPLNIKVIPKNFIFVAGDHKDSFDSRYQEFGLVDIKNIEGKVVPLW